MKSSAIQNKKINTQKLLEYGFIKNKSEYIYSKTILNGEFIINVVADNKDFKANVIEVSTNEPYTLHLLEGVNGSFVGHVKSEYENVISDIIEKCFDMDIFEYEYSKKVIEYAYKKYGSKPEYLWGKFPRNAICRRMDNNKWYFAILSVSKDRFGFDSKEIVEIIDLRVPPNNIVQLLKEPNIYPGYHMNKKHWISIILDKSVKIDKIFEYIDKSYELANKK